MHLLADSPTTTPTNLQYRPLNMNYNTPCITGSSNPIYHHQNTQQIMQSQNPALQQLSVPTPPSYHQMILDKLEVRNFNWASLI